MILKKKKKKKRKKEKNNHHQQTNTHLGKTSQLPSRQILVSSPLTSGRPGAVWEEGVSRLSCFSFSAPCFTLSCSSVGSSTHQNQTCFPCLLSFLLQLLLKLQFCFGVSPVPRVSSLLLLWCVLLLLPPPLALFLLSRCLPVS